MNIIENISIACSCEKKEAEEYLDGEVRNLQDLKRLNDLRYGDFEEACKSLGLDNDYVAYFINAVA